MKKTVAVIAVTLAAVLVFTGCGSGASNEASESEVDEVAVEQEKNEPASEANTDSSKVLSAAAENEPDVAQLALFIDDEVLDVSWEENDAVSALTKLAQSSPLEIKMAMYGGFEQVGSLGTDLPTSDEQTTTQAGDIVLYQGNQIVVFYGSNSWSYTRLGHIEGKTAEELEQILGQQDVTLILTLVVT